MQTWILYTFLTAFIVADCSDPLVWMEDMNQKIIDAIQHTSIEKQTHALNKILLPAVDHEAFVKKIIGRNAWLSATAEQRSEVTKLLSTVIFAEYINGIVTSLAVKPTIHRANLNEVNIITVLYHTQRGKNLLVNFTLVCQENAWKVSEITMTGVRLSDIQQAKYHNVLAQAGVAGLIKNLSE